MSDLVRFGVAMDRALLQHFDRRIAARGYENRSEAIRDLIRADLTRAAWAEGAIVIATLTVVYTPALRSEIMRLTEPEPGNADVFVSSQHVRVDASRCLDTMALRGRAEELGAIAGKIAGIKGVLSCELTVAATLDDPRDKPERAEAPATKEHA